MTKKNTVKVQKPKITFVSYDGSYPNLCRGTFIVKIGNKTVKFRDFTKSEKRNTYPAFWSSGGSVWFGKNWEEHVEDGPWEFGYCQKKDYPKSIADRLDELLKLFNENVPYGCCGGCV